MIKNITIRILSEARLLQDLGVKGYFKYRFSTKGSLIKLIICETEVTVRKGTPDIGVARSSLNNEFEVLKHLLPESYEGLIVDAGGYIGTAAVKFSKMYPNATVVTIEPSSENFSILQKNISDSENISVINAALVASSAGKVKIRNRGTGNWGYSIVSEPKDNPSAPVIETVETVSLEDIKKLFSNEIGILKLDIEGGEKALFDDAIDSLKDIPVIFAELHDRIIDGCYVGFTNLSRNRWVVKTDGEKYLSLLKK